MTQPRLSAIVILYKNCGGKDPPVTARSVPGGAKQERSMNPMKMKRLLASVLALLLVVSLLPMTAMAGDNYGYM